MRRSYRGGYVGLIALIISVAIIGLLFTRTYLDQKRDTQDNPNAEFQPLTASGTVAESGMEQMHADVDAAHAVRDELSRRSRETQAQMDLIDRQ